MYFSMPSASTNKKRKEINHLIRFWNNWHYYSELNIISMTIRGISLLFFLQHSKEKGEKITINLIKLPIFCLKWWLWLWLWLHHLRVKERTRLLFTRYNKLVNDNQLLWLSFLQRIDIYCEFFFCGFVLISWDI